MISYANNRRFVAGKIDVLVCTTILESGIDIPNANTIIVENADRLSHEADTEGITGFMYGCAVSILSQYWEYGEELRKWHNKEYNYDGKGVVNPAIMTIRKWGC